MADFKNGETAFYSNEEYDGQPNGLLNDMKDDWGMVCFPLGPRGDGKYFTLNNDHMLIIPSIYSQDKVNKILKIYDLVTDSVPGLSCALLAWNICGGADIAETYESMKNSLQATIDEAMNK